MKKILNKLGKYFLVGLGGLLFPLNIVFAEVCEFDPLDPLKNFISDGENLGLDSLDCLVSNAISILLIVVVVYAIIRIVLAGIQYSSAIGNPEKTTEAKKALIWSVIGFVVAMSAYAIMSFVTGIV